MEITYSFLTSQSAHLLRDADVFDGPVAPSQLSAFVEDPHSLLVFASQNSEIVGAAFGTILLHPDKPPAFFLNEVGVNEAWRKKGIATRLTQELMAAAWDHGCGEVWLATETDNDAACGLYRKLEGQESGDVVIYDWTKPRVD